MAAQPNPHKPARTLHIASDLRVVLGRLIRRLREQAEKDDLTSSQKSVLGRLEREGPTTISALASAEGVRPQSMGATVSALRTMGFIGAAPDPDDGRQTVLSLSASARRWIATTRAAREDWLFSVIETKLTAAEQLELEKAIALLKRLLE